MQGKKTSVIQSLLGDIDQIVDLLHIESLPEEDQLKIIDRFAEILFKRILLRIPEDRIGKMRQALEGNPETFLQTLEEIIPDIETCIREEIEHTAMDFQINEEIPYGKNAHQ